MLRPFYKKSFSNYIFETYFERPHFSFYQVHQVHGTNIIIDKEAHENIKADGIISYKLYRPLAVKTADCLPVAVIGHRGAALLHIGWRGLSKEILKDTSLGKIFPHFFYVGPHITGPSFQITNEFQDYFPHSKNFFSIGKIRFFSLYGELVDQVQKNFPHVTVSCSELCTYKTKELHSFRRNGTTKRNWNVLKIS